MSITSYRLDLEDSFFNGEDGDVEGATAEVKDENVGFGGSLILVKTVSDGCGRGLVDDTKDVEPGDDASIFSSLRGIISSNLQT